MKYFTPFIFLVNPFLAFGQTAILVDFGKHDLQSSSATDPNGYHWNNIAPVPEADVANGVMGFDKLTEEQKANYTNPGDHFRTPGLLPIVAIENAVDRAGTSTGVSIAITKVTDVLDFTSAGGVFGRTGEEYGDELGAIPTQTGYPATATIDNFYVMWEFEGELTLSGLNDAETYTLKMWGGVNHGAVDSSNPTVPVSFIVNGNVEGEQTIDTFLNTGANPEDYALFENVSPVNGEITILYEQGVEDVGLPRGHWSTLEIIGNFGEGDASWYGFEIDEEGWAETGGWLGMVYVLQDPWIWVRNLGDYAYVSDDSGWIYIPQ